MMARENSDVSNVSSPSQEGDLGSKKSLLSLEEILSSVPSPQMPSG